MEVWTGEEDKILRRLNVQLRFNVPEENREAANGLTGGTLRFDLTLGAINEDQDIKAPEDARPFEELVAAVGQGGAVQEGQGGGQTAPEQGGEAPQAGGGTPYEQCVAEAGADIAKLQECASLQGG